MNKNTRLRGLLLMAVLAGSASAIVAAAGPASAAVPGLQIAATTSANDSVAVKSAFVTCPAGKQVVGAGGQINTDTSGRVVIDEITPTPDLSGVVAVGVETAGGTTSNWTVRAFAVCANGGGVPGLQLVQQTSAVNSSAVKSVSTACPSGKKVIGAGGQINTDSSGAVALDEITPLATNVTAVGAEVGAGTASNWSMRSYAICANNGLPGLQIVSAQSAVDSSSAKSAFAACPAGTKVIGTGGQINTASSGRAVVDEITPFPNLSGVSAIGVETGVGTTDNWSVQAYAVCATP